MNSLRNINRWWHDLVPFLSPRRPYFWIIFVSVLAALAFSYALYENQKDRNERRDDQLAFNEQIRAFGDQQRQFNDRVKQLTDQFCSAIPNAAGAGAQALVDVLVADARATGESQVEIDNTLRLGVLYVARARELALRDLPDCPRPPGASGAPAVP